MFTPKNTQLEEEINFLKSSNFFFPLKFIKQGPSEYFIIISIPLHALTEEEANTSKSTQSDVQFLLHVTQNYPFTSPKLYCISSFCFPNICDGRDLIEDVLDSKWNSGIKLVEVISSIQKFLIDYKNNVSKNEIKMVGKYYLDKKYEFNIISSLPVYFKKVTEVYNISKNKEKEEQRFLLIGDIFILLFDFNALNYMDIKLIFWANIRSLISMREIVGSGKFEMKFNSKNGLTRSLTLITSDGSKIIDMIMNNLKQFNINFIVNRKNLGPKEGTLPPVDIELVENQIREMEERIVHESTPEIVQYLIDLYQRAIQFYSAINNDRYLVFMKATKEIMGNEKYRKLLESANIMNQNNNLHVEEKVREREKEEGKEVIIKNDKNKDKEKENLEVNIKDNNEDNIDANGKNNNEDNSNKEQNEKNEKTEKNDENEEKKLENGINEEIKNEANEEINEINKDENINIKVNNEINENKEEVSDKKENNEIKIEDKKINEVINKEKENVNKITKKESKGKSNEKEVKKQEDNQESITMIKGEDTNKDLNLNFDDDEEDE